MDEHAHVEAPRPFGHLTADAPEADDAQRGVVDVRPEQQQRSPGQPAARANVVVALGQPPGRGHQQRPGEVGRRLGQHARRIADRDAAARAGGHVDVVEADGEVADHPEAWASGVEQLVVDAIGEQGEQPIHATNALEQRGARRRQLVGPEVDLEGGERGEALVRQASGDEDPGPSRAHATGVAARTSAIRSNARRRFSCELA